MAVIRIKNLLLRTIVGIKKEEREKKQDVMINIELEMDLSKAAVSDQIEDTLDYRTLTKKIIQLVENSQFFLVEALADGILKLVMMDPRVEKGRVEVDKPHALRFAQSVSIEVQGLPIMNQVAISVGSNINPEENIQKAREILGRDHQMLGASVFIWTEPVDLPPQANFLNGAFLVETALDHESFRAYLKEVEKKLGRVAQDKLAPRTIDLDIVVWNGQVVHRDFHNRDFVRKGVVELLPKLEEGENEL